MKNILFSLFVLSSISIFAQNNEEICFNDPPPMELLGCPCPRCEQNQNETPLFYYENKEPKTEACEKPCEPCCVPIVKPCIHCECYLPAYYSLQCAWGLTLSADFLYWFARENNIPYAVRFENQVVFPATTNRTVFTPQSYQQLDTKWAPGFRVGIGKDFGCDGFDTFLNYTWYRNNQTNKTSVTPTALRATIPDFPAIDNFGLLNPWINAAVGGIASTDDLVVNFDTVKAHWSFQLNQIDWEWGLKVWMRKNFTIRPFLGVRGAWIQTKFKTLSSLNTGTGTTAISRTFSDKFKDRYWGVGIVGGLQPSFYFGCSKEFTFFANIDGSLIYGNFKSSKKENYQQVTGTAIVPLPGGPPNDVDFNDSSHNQFYQMVPILDLALGLGWERMWNCDRYRTQFTAGWEHHIWWNINHRVLTISPDRQASSTPPSFNQGAFTGFSQANTDIMFGGLVIRAQFEF